MSLWGCPPPLARASDVITVFSTALGISWGHTSPPPSHDHILYSHLLLNTSILVCHKVWGNTLWNSLCFRMFCVPGMQHDHFRFITASGQAFLWSYYFIDWLNLFQSSDQLILVKVLFYIFWVLYRVYFGFSSVVALQGDIHDVNSLETHLVCNTCWTIDGQLIV